VPPGHFERAQTELFADDAIRIGIDGAPVDLAERLEANQTMWRGSIRGVEAVYGALVSEPTVAGSLLAGTGHKQSRLYPDRSGLKTPASCPLLQGTRLWTSALKSPHFQCRRASSTLLLNEVATA
jgi:hypothetical protein